jgi:hypothetical protein
MSDILLTKAQRVELRATRKLKALKKNAARQKVVNAESRKQGCVLLPKDVDAEAARILHQVSTLS